MIRFAPQKSLFDIIEIIQNINNYLFWGIFTFSIIQSLEGTFTIIKSYKGIIDFIVFLMFIISILITLVSDYLLLPKAEYKRRNAFVDNSLGSKFELKSSQEYFTNDKVPYGLYKMAINSFENCFFTRALLAKLTAKKIIKVSIVILAVLISAYLGFSKVPFFMTLLQAFFSSQLLLGLISHIILRYNISNVLENWKMFFNTKGLDNNLNNGDIQSIMKNMINYETSISYYPSNIPDKIFFKRNDTISKERDQTKEYYKISDTHS